MAEICYLGLFFITYLINSSRTTQMIQLACHIKSVLLSYIPIGQWFSAVPYRRHPYRGPRPCMYHSHGLRTLLSLIAFLNHMVYWWHCKLQLFYMKTVVHNITINSTPQEANCHKFLQSWPNLLCLLRKNMVPILEVVCLNNLNRSI